MHLHLTLKYVLMRQLPNYVREAYERDSLKDTFARSPLSCSLAVLVGASPMWPGYSFLLPKSSPANACKLAASVHEWAQPTPRAVCQCWGVYTLCNSPQSMRGDSSWESSPATLASW